jgi:hypothetical protein
MKNTDCELHGWYPTTQGLCPTCSACKERDELRAEVERLRGVSILVQSPSHEEFLRMRVEMGALREALAKSELQVREMTEAIQKIHDLTGQITPEHHLNLGAIQAWCHKVLGPCTGERHHHENCDTLDPFGRDKPCNCGFTEKKEGV